jgi:hypothetical protein
MIWKRRAPSLTSLPNGEFAGLLRCEQTRQDDNGWLATFSGKPNTAGNRITIPVNAETANALQVGAEYHATMRPWIHAASMTVPAKETGDT